MKTTGIQEVMNQINSSNLCMIYLDAKGKLKHDAKQNTRPFLNKNIHVQQNESIS